MLVRSRHVFNSAEVNHVRSSRPDNLGKSDQSPAMLCLSHREPSRWTISKFTILPNNFPNLSNLDQNNPSFRFRGSFLCVTNKEIQTNPMLRFYLQLRNWNVFFWGRKTWLSQIIFWLISLPKFSMNILVMRKLLVVGERKASTSSSLSRHLQSMLSLACSLSHKHCPCFMPLQSVPWKMRPMRMEQRPRWSATAASVPVGTGCAPQWRARVRMLSRNLLCLGLDKRILTLFLPKGTSYPGFSLQLFLSFSMVGFCITLTCSMLVKPKLVLLQRSESVLLGSGQCCWGL